VKAVVAERMNQLEKENEQLKNILTNAQLEKAEPWELSEGIS
jgi:hypothetical protein